MTGVNYHSTVSDAVAILTDGLGPFVDRVFAHMLPPGRQWTELLRHKDMVVGRRGRHQLDRLSA